MVAISADSIERRDACRSSRPRSKVLGMTAFDDLDDYLALPRATRLVMSPDGARLVLAQSTLDDTATSFVGALWDIDPSGGEPARRLTHGPKGESNPAFSATGDVLFTAVRGGDDEPATLWRLPAAGGEAEQVVARKGGVAGVHSASHADRIVLAANVLGHSDTDDERVRATRKDLGVSAVMHTGYPVRYWDHDLGPDRPHLLTIGADGEPTDLTPASAARCATCTSTSLRTARSPRRPGSWPGR